MPVISLVAFAVYGSSMAFVLAALRRGDIRLPGEGRSPARRVALAGLLAALTALMQGSATFWPGVGHLLATLSTLPVAVGTLAAPQSAVALVLAAAGTLALVHGHQAVVFLLTTGPLGVTAAWAAAGRAPFWLRWLLPGATLSSGILLLVRVVGVPVFGGLARSRGVAVATLSYVVFGLLYAPLWVVFLRGFFCRRSIGFRLAEEPPGLLPGRGEAVDGEEGQGPGHNQDEAEG